MAFEALERRRHGPQGQDCDTGITIVSGDLHASGALRHHYNAHIGSCSYSRSEEMDSFTENEVMHHEPSSIDVGRHVELVTGPQSQDSRPRARNNGGDTTSAQAIHERSRFRHERATVWLVKPVLSCRQEMPGRGRQGSDKQ